MYSLDQAKQIVLHNMDPGTVIRSGIRHEDEYLFLAIRPDPLEGEYDPFVKVHAISGEFHDFSPQAYDTPGLIIDRLVENSNLSKEKS